MFEILMVSLSSFRASTFNFFPFHILFMINSRRRWNSLLYALLPRKFLSKYFFLKEINHCSEDSHRLFKISILIYFLVPSPFEKELILLLDIQFPLSRRISSSWPVHTIEISGKDSNSLKRASEKSQSELSTTKDLVSHNFLCTYHNVYLHYPNTTSCWKSPTTKPTTSPTRNGVIAFPFRAFLPLLK